MNRLRVVLRVFRESDIVKRIPRRPTQSLYDFPTYTIPEAALYLAMPTSTLRYWLRNHPLWKIADRGDRFSLLSFKDLTQAYYVEAARTHLNFTLSEMRDVLVSASKESRSEYPLLQKNILVHAKHVLMDKAARGKQPRRMVDLSRHRQLVIPDIVAPLATRILRERGNIVQLFPWRLWTGKAADKTRPVSIAPDVMSGKLVVTGTRIPVEVIVERTSQRESVRSIARDYRLSEDSIKQALRHLVPKAA